MTLYTLLALTCASFLTVGGVHYISARIGLTTARRLGRRTHPIPPSSEGGLAFAICFIACLTVTANWLRNDLWLTREEMNMHHAGIGFAVFWIWAFGRFGDSGGYSHIWSLAAVITGSLILIFTGFVMHLVTYRDQSIALGIFSFPATILWIVVISEFFRLFEGLDGLMPTMAITGILLLVFRILPPEEEYARTLCFSALPALLGILPWQVYPCKVELRGIGAFLPGFIFGAITLVGREKAFTAKTVMIPSAALILVAAFFVLWLLEQRLFPSRKKD